MPRISVTFNTFSCLGLCYKTLPFDPLFMSATVTVLDQGLTLIHQELPHISTATIDVWIGGGSGMETEQNRGVAHFVEHMIFKGTDRVKPGEFDRLIESLGSVSSAATSYDYTRYSLTTPKENFAKVLTYLSDVILYALIPEGEMEPERQVVLAELSQAWSDPEWISYHILLATIFADHPYGIPVIGSADQVNGLQAQDLRAFHREHYQRGTLTVVVVGAVSLEETIDQVRSRFCPSPRVAPSCPCYPIAPLEGIRREQISLPHLSHDRLLLAWLGPQATAMTETIGMEMLSIILTEGHNSRLSQALKPWIKNIDSVFITQQWAGFFTISVTTNQEYLEIVEDGILEQVRAIVTQPIGTKELKRAQKCLSHNFAFTMESPTELAHFLGYHALLGVYDFCHHWHHAYVDLIYSLTTDDLQELAHTYLVPDRYVAINVNSSPPE